MGDFSNYGGSDEENAEIQRLYAEVVGSRALRARAPAAFDDRPADH